MTRIGVAVVVVVLGVGCGKRADAPSERGATATPPAPAVAIDATPAAAVDAAPAAVDTAPAGGSPEWGEPCPTGTCATGFTCTSWHTEGGERRATCEIPCGPAPSRSCPPDLGCTMQGGGPSDVCLGTAGSHKR